jgi:uroporphyrinogen-III synthase
MSLAGLTVAVTASRRAQELANLIRRLGGRPYIAPTVAIEEDQDISKIAQDFSKKLQEDYNIDYVIFMTGTGVYTLMSAAQKLGIDKRIIDRLQHTSIISRSLKPKVILQKYGVKTNAIPEENTAEGIVKMLTKSDISGKKIVVLWHGSYSRAFKDILTDAGAEIFEFSTYKYSAHLKNKDARILKDMGFNYVSADEERVIRLIEDIIKGNIDAITFTSPPSARDIFLLAESHGLKESLTQSLNKNVIVVSVGPSTKKAIEENTVQVDVMPELYKMGPMIKALSDYISKSETRKKRAK